MCCCSTPPAPTSRPTRTSMLTARRGSGGTGIPRITARTCRRSSSGWPAPPPTGHPPHRPSRTLVRGPVPHLPVFLPHRGVQGVDQRDLSLVDQLLQHLPLRDTLPGGQPFQVAFGGQIDHCAQPLGHRPIRHLRIDPGGPVTFPVTGLAFSVRQGHTPTLPRNGPRCRDLVQTSIMRTTRFMPHTPRLYSVTVGWAALACWRVLAVGGAVVGAPAGFPGGWCPSVRAAATDAGARPVS